jgi:hypothetical protein
VVGRDYAMKVHSGRCGGGLLPINTVPSGSHLFHINNQQNRHDIRAFDTSWLVQCTLKVTHAAQQVHFIKGRGVFVVHS